MAKATFDWQFHINNYVDHFADSMSLVEYALANDLNRNSVRRSMGAAVAAALEAKGAAARATAEGAQGADLKMGKVVRREVRKMVTEKREEKAAEDAKGGPDHVIRSGGGGAADQPITSSGSTSPDQQRKRAAGSAKPAATRGAAKKGGRSDQARGEGAGESVVVGEYLGNSEDQTPTRPKNRRGGARNVLLGRYASQFGIDPEMLEMVSSDEYADDELTLARARLAGMYKTRGEALQKIRKDYSKGGPWLDDNGAAMPKEQALMQVEFGTSQPITELEKSIHRQKATYIKLAMDSEKLELERRKLALAEWSRHPLSLAQRIARTAELLELRNQEGLTAIETATLFNREGIDLPDALHAEMIKEISWLEPRAEQGSGITEEELERESRAYREKMRVQTGEWLSGRNEEISGIIAEEAAHQAGELLGEAAFKKDAQEGELILAGDDGRWHPDDALPLDDDPQPGDWDEESWEAE